MKTIKLLFSAILMMVAFGAQAQVVQVMKDGKVVKEYPASQVRSVEYKPVYYYYAGWECPKNEAELANMAKGLNGGYELTADAINHDWSADGNQIIGDEEMPEALHMIVVVPEGIKIWDTLGNDITTSAFKVIEGKSISGYNMYESKGTFWDIKVILVHK